MSALLRELRSAQPRLSLRGERRKAIGDGILKIEIVWIEIRSLTRQGLAFGSELEKEGFRHGVYRPHGFDAAPSRPCGGIRYEASRPWVRHENCSKSAKAQRPIRVNAQGRRRSAALAHRKPAQ